MNARANGQVERYVKVAKACIRLLQAECADIQWWELLPDVARACRLIPTRATGYSPFVLVFK